MWLKGLAWAFLGLSSKSMVPLFSRAENTLTWMNLWHMVLTHILWTMVEKTSLTIPLTNAQQGLMRAYPWHGQVSLFLSCNKTVPCWTDFVILLVHLTKWQANLQSTPKTFYIIPILTSGGLVLKVHTMTWSKLTLNLRVLNWFSAEIITLLSPRFWLDKLNHQQPNTQTKT